MALLGDMQARVVRTALFEGGAFTEVHAFPQKDDPRKRIFKEAKLSTCVFFYSEVDTPGEHIRPGVAIADTDERRCEGLQSPHGGR